MKTSPNPKSINSLRNRHAALFVAAGIACSITTTKSFAQTNNYFGTTGTLSGSVWSTNPAGPYTSALNSTGGAIINFGNAATFNGATIIVAGINATANATIGTNTGTISNFSNGVITIDVGTGATLDFGAQAFTTSATAGYIKNGSGVLALAGGTYGGGFTINSGTVILRGTNAMGSGGALTINGGTIAANATRDLTGRYTSGITVGGDFTLGATTGLALGAANLTFSNSVSLGSATRKITIGGTGVYAFGGGISGASGTGLIVDSTATGILSFTTAATYNGGTTIKGGILNDGLAVGAHSDPFGGGAITLGDSSGNKDAVIYRNVADTNVSLFTSALTVANGSSSNTLAIAGNNSTITFNNTVALNNNLTLANGNTGKIITLSGKVTQISNGTGYTITNGATVAGTAATAALTGQAILSGGVEIGTGGLTLANSAPSTYIVSTGNITSTTTGNLTLNANSTGAFTISAPSINNAGSITNSGTGSGTTTISGVIGTSVTGVTQNGASTLSLTGANTYSGSTTLTSGTLNIGVTSVGSGGSLASGAVGTGTLTINGGTISSGAVNGFGVTNTLVKGDFTIASTARLTWAGAWDLQGAQRNVSLTQNQSFANAILSSNVGFRYQATVLANSGLTNQISNGTLRFVGGTGMTTITGVGFQDTMNFASNSGLIIGSGVIAGATSASAAFGAGTNAPALTVESGGYFNLSIANAEIYSLSGVGTITNLDTVANTRTLAINNGNSATFTGVITDGTSLNATTGITALGKVALTKSGSSAQTLTGNNTYTGNTTVSGGTLLINNTTGSGTGSGNVTVSNTGTLLGGTGTISGSVSIGAGSQITGGTNTTAGLLNTGALTLSSGTSTLSLQVVSAGTTKGTNFDSLNVTGALTYGSGTLLVTDVGAFDLSGQSGTYDLLDATSFSGDLGMVTVDSISLTRSGSIWSGGIFSFDQTTGILDVTAVPEPSTYIGGGLILGLAAWSQRKRFAA